MPGYSELSDRELEANVRTWNILQTIALVLFGLGFFAWLVIDSWRSQSIIFILLMGSISTIVLILGHGPRQMAAELERRKSSQ